MKSFLLLFSLFFTLNICAQQSAYSVEFDLTVNGKSLELGKNYELSANDDNVTFDVLRFYISDLQLIDNEKIIYESEKKYNLIDLEKPESLQISMNEYSGKFDRVKFTFGIDSLTNVSGAMGGDLDPLHGMYWTWQNGYINFKLEGRADKCPARKNEFMFHLGGYQTPNLVAQEVELEIHKAAKSLKIILPIDKLLSQINLVETYRLMSPNQEAVEMSRLISSLFSVEKL
jgi:hypothetical protein